MSVSRALIRDIIRQRDEPAAKTWLQWQATIRALRRSGGRGRPPTRYIATVRRSAYPDGAFDLLIGMAAREYDVTVLPNGSDPDSAKVVLKWP